MKHNNMTRHFGFSLNDLRGHRTPLRLVGEENDEQRNEREREEKLRELDAIFGK